MQTAFRSLLLQVGLALNFAVENVCYLVTTILCLPDMSK